MTSIGATDAFATALAHARRTWPRIELSDETFASAIAARISADVAGSTAELEAAIARLHPADLFLAEACVRGDPRAAAGFAELVGRAIARPVGAILGTAAAVDDVCQIVCQRLLVATGEQPAIAGYNGGVRLASWVRVIATRIAIDERRKRSRDRPLEATLVESLAAEGVSPELAELKARYRAQFKAAVEAAVGALSDRDRGVLRFTVEHDLTADEVGRIFHVHRVTVARWLRRIREALAAQILRELAVEPAELASMLRLVKSQISLSIQRLLTA